MNELHPGLLEPGTTIGDSDRYFIVETIAVGGMACIYLASDTCLGNDCAVKALALPADFDNSESLNRFHEEATLLARLNHPGVVGVRDYFEQDNHAFLIMDFVPGANLFDLHKSPHEPGRLISEIDIAAVPESVVVSYGLMLAETLSRLHRSQPPIVYRDLKPHNIIRRSTDGRLILLDFGIARCFLQGEKAARGEAIGTPGYAAPEQYEVGSPHTARTDIYALGVVLHELATGYNPRRERGFSLVPKPQDVRPGLSPTLARVIERCCQFDPDRRFGSAHEVYDALDRWAPAKSGGRRRSHVAATPAWTIDLGAPVTAAPLGSGAAVYYADNGGMICGIDPGTGEPLWLYREPGDRTSPILVHTSLLDTGSEKLFAYSFPMGEDQQGVSVLDARSGAAVWRSHQALGRNAIPILTDCGQLVVATSDPDQVAGIPVNCGLSDWRRSRMAAPLTLTKAPAAPCRPELIVIADREGVVRALQPDTGRVVWSNTISHGPLVAPPLIDNDTVYLGGARGDTSYAGVSLDTGEILWRTQTAAEVIGPAAMAAGDLLVVPTRNAGLIGLDATTGRKRWHEVGFTRPLSGAARLRGGHMVAVTEFGPGGRIIVVNVTGEPEIVWEAHLEQNGSVAPPLITGEFLLAAASEGVVTAWALT